MQQWRRLVVAALSLAATLASGPVAAGIALDRVIVELEPRDGSRGDIEVQNVGETTQYVVVEASEVRYPGTEREERFAAADPEALGLLVTPNRLVLEPGARRVVRFVRLGPPSEQERVWRVAVRPVVGETTAASSALKVLVGYGVLVLAPPEDAVSAVIGERSGRRLELRNEGNANALVFDGTQCDGNGRNCRELPAKRLYAGSRWVVDLPYGTASTWRVQAVGTVETRHF